MNTQTITLTPPIDEVQYGYLETEEIKQADEGYYVYVMTDNVYFTKGIHLLQPFNTVKDHFGLFHPDKNFEKSSYVVIKIDKEVQNPKQYDNGNCFCNVKYIKKVICSTNPKDTRFPFLVMPKEQEVDLSFAIWYSGMEKARVQSAYKRFVKKTGYINPAKYTQEQMEKAIFQAKLGTQLTVTERYSGEDGVDNLTKDILQSIQPTAKAVRVEMEESYGDLLPAFGGHYIYKLKVEQSTEYSQGIVRAIEVIY